MELKIRFETEIEYFDKMSLDLGWFKKLADFIYENLFSLNRNYYSIVERQRERRQRQQRLIDYPYFYYSGYIKFFTERKEIIYPFDNENSKNVVDFMGSEIPLLYLFKYFQKDESLTLSKPTTLGIKLKLDLVEKI